jgi:hypothetical protein
MCLAIRKLRSDTTSKNKAPSPWYKRTWTSVAAFKKHRTTAATICALKDFQEAQIFFSLTLNIASPIALYQSKTRLMAPTVAELVANRFLFKIIGAIGSYPVVLNLCILRHNRRVLSRFILIASFCCLVLATLTWSLAIATTIESSQLQRQDYRFEACGGENPMQHCFGDFAVDKTIEWWSERWSLTVFARVFLSSPPIAVPILVFAALVTKSFRPRQKQKQKQKHTRKTPYNILASMLGLLLILAELWLFLTTTMLLIAVSLLLVPVSHRQPRWQIGQILAVAVWVPVLAKWLHRLCGTSEQAVQKQPWMYNVKLISIQKIQRRTPSAARLPMTLRSEGILKNARCTI